MKLKVTIDNIKSIKHLSVDLPLEKGLYAITGENASGKSTLVTCSSLAFYSFDVKQYLGNTPNGHVQLELNDQKAEFDLSGSSANQIGYINIKGFFEGSLIFGNRFRNTYYTAVEKLDSVQNCDLEKADDFIRENLGYILCNDKTYYQDLFRLKNGRDPSTRKTYQNKYKLGGIPYFYVRDGQRINQAHMSTGENLLLSILHSLKLRIDDRGSKSIPCLIFLDEIELALHASSLKRLSTLLEKMATTYNMAIYFSTHSIELIRDIVPENIFYIQKYFGNRIGIQNPCYPAYATKNLYDSNMGYDTVILVEDDLAREIILQLLKKHSLLRNNLVCTLPCGGWQNVLRLAQDVKDSQLLGNKSKLVVVLDGDIESHVPDFIEKNGLSIAFPLNYLPIPSLEKYIKNRTFDDPQIELVQSLDYLFQTTTLKSILQDYYNSDVTKDENGKKLFKKIQEALEQNRKTRKDVIEIVLQYMEEYEKADLERIEAFLKNNI